MEKIGFMPYFGPTQQQVNIFLIVFLLFKEKSHLDIYDIYNK